MTSKVSVTLMTRKPFAAAFELDCDDVVLRAIMRTTRLRIDFDAVNFHALRSRGQTSTSSEPMIQQPIIIAKPLLNEPLC